MIFIIVLLVVSVISYGVGYGDSKFELWLKWQDGYHEGYAKAMKEVKEVMNGVPPEANNG